MSCDFVKLSNQTLWVLCYLSGGDTGKFTSPTEIGNMYRPRYHSAWASPKLKILVREGLAERNKNGHYRITNTGLDFVKDYLKQEGTRD